MLYDSIAPTGTITVNGGETGTSSLVVPVVVAATDANGVYPLLSNDGTTWTAPSGSGSAMSWNVSTSGGTSAQGPHTVWWKLADPAGNQGPPTSVTLVFDSIAPRITAPSVPAIVVTQTAGTSGASLRFSWAGSDNTGVVRYDVQRSTNGGAWTTVARPTSASLRTTATYKTSVRYRVRAVDVSGNVSGWVHTTTVKLIRTQETSSSIVYHGAWKTSSASKYLGGSLRRAGRAGASVGFRFTGRSIAWVAAKGPTRGKATIYIDGKYVTTINLHSATGSFRQVVFARRWSSSRTHTIKIVVRGTPGHPRVDLDAFLRLG